MKQTARDYADYKLKDDSSLYGGISFIGETLKDFIEECELSLDLDINEVNKILKANGIKPVKVVNGITCQLDNGNVILLDNVYETIGHDDSLPFIATIKYETKNKFETLGNVSNDGWGGDSVINPLNDECKTLLDEIDKYLRNNYEMVVSKNIKWDVKLEYLLSSMAYLYIDCGIHSINMNNFDVDCKRKQTNI